MAEEIKQKYSDIQQKKKIAKNDEFQIDEFEWIKVSTAVLCVIHVNEIILQLNQELAINRESGKKHQESPKDKLIRKFSENPLIPMGKYK